MQRKGGRYIVRDGVPVPVSEISESEVTSDKPVDEPEAVDTESTTQEVTDHENA